MLVLLITICTIGGSAMIGVTMVIGFMLHSGRIALPNSPQRRVQQAKVEREVALLNRDRSEALLETAKNEAHRTMMEIETNFKIAEAQQRNFQKKLEASNAPSRS